MAQQGVSVKVLGLEKLHGKLGDGVPAEFKRFIFKLKGHALKEAKERAKPHSGDVGSVAQSLKGFASVATLTARISTGLPIARQVEEGRKGGKPPGPRQLQRWMKRHNIPADWRTVKAMRAAMKSRGTKGVAFMEGAGRDTQEHLPGFIDEAEAGIRKAWAA